MKQMKSRNIEKDVQLFAHACMKIHASGASFSNFQSFDAPKGPSWAG